MNNDKVLLGRFDTDLIAYLDPDTLIDQVTSQFNEASKAAEPLTFSGYVRKTLGYPYQKHQYTTKDGYINSVMRIPGPKGYNSDDNKEKRPVIIY